MLVVLDRDTRTSLDRQRGLPSSSRINPPPRGIVTLSGVVTEVPHAEAMYSWRLTRRDADLLAERGVYIRANAIVSARPVVPGEHAPEQVDEWNRETAPPPSERPIVLPPLVVPAPPP